MSLEIPSACAPVRCSVCHGLAACAARGASPISRGSRLPAASRRNDAACGHLVWSGPSQGLGVESQRPPRRLRQWTPLPGCCMSAAIWLVYSSSLGSEWNGAVQKNSGAGQGCGPTLEMPALGSSRRARNGQGLRSIGEPPVPSLREPARAIRKWNTGTGNLRVGGTLAAAFRVLPGAPWVGWVWLTGSGRGAWE